MKATKLPAKRQRFVEEYLIDLNGTQAAIRAGYSPKTANEQAARLLANVSVQEAVAKAQTKRSETTKVTAEWIMAELVKNQQRAMQAEPVLDSLGRPTGVYRYEGNVANKALELLGKHIGIPDRQQIELSGPDAGPVQFQGVDAIRKALQDDSSRLLLGDLSDRLTGFAACPESGSAGGGGQPGQMEDGSAPVHSEPSPDPSRNGKH